MYFDAWMHDVTLLRECPHIPKKPEQNFIIKGHIHENY